MAIIYTYPIVTPQLQDLVVITDASDKNFTKQASIQDIIDLFYFDCSKCDYCTTSISEITSPFGDTVTALACDTGINFTSSDASVTITGDNLTNTINFKASGGGGGGCPATYVLKPVTCEGDDCFVSEKPNEWIYTCDETLGALAPGYIDNVILNGVVTDGCWYIELATFSASATTCETCCPPGEPEYKLTPCDGGTKYYTDASLTPGIVAVVGLVVLATTPDGTKCYTVTEESGDTPIIITLISTVADCSALDCGTPPTPTYTWENCSTSVQFTTEEFIIGAVVGQVYEYCCDDGDAPVTECFEYLGDIGELAGGTPPCNPLMSTIFAHDNCECCLYKCVYEYTACPGNPTSLPNTIYHNAGLGDVDPNPCDCAIPVANPVFATAEGETWCYTLGDQVCLPPTDGVFITNTADCEDALWCPPIPDPGTYTWQSCDEGGPHVTVAVDPGIPIGQIHRYCCDEGEMVNYCYEYLGDIGETVGGSYPCAGPTEIYDEDCDCCNYPCTYTYSACPGHTEPFPSTIIIDVMMDETGCSCNTPDTDIYIAIGPDTWCYNNPVKACLPATHGPIMGLAVCGDGEICPTPDLNLRWRKCTEGDDDWRYEDELDPIAAPFNVPGNHYIGELNTPGVCVNGDCCIEVEETTEVGDPTPWSSFISETLCDSAYNATWEDCACCVNHDVVEYTACDETCEVDGIHYPTLYVDVCLWGDYHGESWKPSNAPMFIRLTPSGEECCYELTNTSPCIPETLISTHGFDYDSIEYGDPLWEECTCTDIVYFQYRECGSEVWIDTNTDLESYNNGGAWGDGGAENTCYEIQEGGSGGPEIIPEDLFVNEYFGVGELLPCDCCEQDLREYNVCEDAPGVTCNAAAPATLLIDVSLVPGWDPATYSVIVGEEITSSIQCCYILNAETPECEAPTGTIIASVIGCEEDDCNLL